MSVQTSASSPRTSHAARTPTARTPHHIPSSASSISYGLPPLLSPSAMKDCSPVAKPRSPSPNYFGFTANATSHLPVSTHNGNHHARQNWSPPSSAVRSTAAASPSTIPVDRNPDYAAFRRQSEGMSFNLGSLHTFSSPVAQPQKSRTSTENSPSISLDTTTRSPPVAVPSHAILDLDPANLGRSPKRHLSSDSTTTPPDFQRKQSPAVRTTVEMAGLGDPISLSSQSSQPPLFALPRPLAGATVPRAETVPAGNASSSTAEQAFVTVQHVVGLLDTESEDVLLLDLRVSTHYARSRINGALNLCIPTTLMKRPSFNVAKLAETFKNAEQRSRFEKWKNSKYLIVYDASASQAKDAAICLNTLKKFESQGYEGNAYIIKGGFAEFAKAFPAHVDKHSNSTPHKMSMRGDNEPLPVLGGCPMPATDNAANPFFGNIRQNMDLIGGVGQMPVKRPDTLSGNAWRDVPLWLRKAADVKDNGKAVSDKFLHIEKGEQRRMQDALSGKVSYGAPTSETVSNVQIAGIEKGAKNRYNNIWPFEHSRVRLEDIEHDGCDYLNASHISFPLTNKKYIATQCPIPATFADFWNAVWQQDVRVIVMLTAEKEGNQIKAHDYWSGKDYGPFRLEQLSERRATVDPAKITRHRSRQSSDFRRSSGNEPKPSMDRADSARNSGEEPFITVRKLTISHGDYPFEPIREITHLQCSSWPDFGAPAHPAHLLGLIEQCNAVIRSGASARFSEPESANSRSVIVHCSAGCGRTGTFCTVDSVIDMLKRQRSVRSKRKRDQTPGGIDTEMELAASMGATLSPKKKPSLERDMSDPFFSPPSASDKSSTTDSDEASSPVTPGWDDSLDIDGNWLQRNDVDLIQKTVEHFRRQRLSMVQSLRQFVLCYESVLEWLAAENKLELSE